MNFSPDNFISKHTDNHNINDTSNMLKFTSSINCFSNTCNNNILRSMNFDSTINQTDLNQLIPSCSKDFSNQTSNSNASFINQTFPQTISGFTKSNLYASNNNNIFANNESFINGTRLNTQFSSLPSIMLNNEDTNFQQHIYQLYGINTTNYSQNNYEQYFAAATAANFATTLNNENQNIKSASFFEKDNSYKKCLETKDLYNNVSTTTNYLKLPFTTFEHTSPSTTTTTFINSFINTPTTITSNTKTKLTTNFNNLANLWPINNSQNFIPNLPFTFASNPNEHKKS